MMKSKLLGSLGIISKFPIGIGHNLRHWKKIYNVLNFIHVITKFIGSTFFLKLGEYNKDK